jgi:peptide/nickel transport system permease protein
MLAYVVRRLAQSLAALAFMSVLVFAAVYAVGNPVDILVNPQSDQNEIARATAALGLDRPLAEQYFLFLKDAGRGDLGKSFAYNVPAIGLILERMPATLELATAAMLIALLLGIPLGLWAGVAPRSAAGRTIALGSILGFSLPTFWVGLMLIMVFSVWLGWLPASGGGPPPKPCATSPSRRRTSRCSTFRSSRDSPARARASRCSATTSASPGRKASRNDA